MIGSPELSGVGNQKFWFGDGLSEVFVLVCRLHHLRGIQITCWLWQSRWVEGPRLRFRTVCRERRGGLTSLCLCGFNSGILQPDLWARAGFVLLWYVICNTW